MEERSSVAFFKVNVPNLSQWKHLKGNSGRASLFESLVVQRHYVVGADAEQKQITVSMAPAIVYSDCSLTGASLLLLTDADLSKVHVWDIVEGAAGFDLVSTHLPADMQDAARSVPQQMADASAWPGSEPTSSWTTAMAKTSHTTML